MRAPPLGPAYSTPNYFYPAAYKLSTTTAYSTGFYSGSLFSAMKTEYVVVAEQAAPLGPAYSTFPTSYQFGLRMPLTGKVFYTCIYYMYSTIYGLLLEYIFFSSLYVYACY